MTDIPERAAALIFDENGVWLVIPDWAQDDSRSEFPDYISAARELAMQLSSPQEIAALAAAFQSRRDL